MVLAQPAVDLLQVKLFAFADNHHNPGDKQCTFHGYSNFFYGIFSNFNCWVSAESVSTDT